MADGAPSQQTLHKVIFYSFKIRTACKKLDPDPFSEKQLDADPQKMNGSTAQN